jgi:HK97 gp10 family phage protein
MSALEGFKELNDKLVALGKDASGRELRNALFQASLPALQAIRAAAPVGTVAHKTYMGRLVAPGFLSRNIRRKSMLRTQNARAMVLIGPADEAFYAQFLERGTAKMSARPFMEAAFRRAQAQVIARFGERLERQIQRTASRRK